MSSATNDVKSKLIALIERAEANETALLTKLSDEEKAAVGESDNWTVKDQIVHLNYWRARALQGLIALRDGTTKPEHPDEEDDVVNGRNFAAHQHDSWDEVTGESERLCREAKQVISQLTEAQLTEPDAPTPGSPVRADHLVSDFMEHPAEHLAYVSRQLGDTAEAERLENATIELLRKLSAQNWVIYGWAVYNLACAYAKRGESAKAIEALREALPLSPRLKAKAPEDSDLESLRSLPEFQALIAS